VSSDPIELLQLAALHHAANGAADTVFTICDVTDFEPGPQQDLAAIVVSLMHDGEVNAMSVFHRCTQGGKGLLDFYVQRVRDEFYGSPGYCANAVRDHANMRRLAASVTRAQAAIEQGKRSVEEITADLAAALDEQEAYSSSGLGIIDFTDMWDTPEDVRKWVVPHMLRQNERLILTGPEGGGKSVLVAQMALGAAMGVNTMSPGLETHDPLRVLMLDVENDRLQIKSNMRKIVPILNEMSGGVTPLIEWVDVRDIDLSEPVERQRVIRLAKERQPQLMYLGSLYKLAPEGDRVDTAFGHVSRTVDRIRAETNTSILIEAHTGHGMQNDRNGAMRPYGSSMWLRWPEFGMAMIPRRDHKGVAEVKHWRGARSDDRIWPAGLRRSGTLPWAAIPAEEWEAVYAS
jgi:replicative DNA helicase